MSNKNQKNLSKVHYNFCTLVTADEELCGPYFNCLSIHYIINGIYLIRLKKGITKQVKGLNFVNNKITLAKCFSDKADSLGLKHNLSFENNGYNGFYFYVGCWQPESDIKKAKDYLTEINKAKKSLNPVKVNIVDLSTEETPF